MKSKDPTNADLTGLIVIDKPLGITSHGVVARVRRLAGTRRVGHAGTLDPDASGVLVLGLGTATKLLGYIAGTSKEYLATLRLGASTTTDDAEGEVVEAPGWPHDGHVLAEIARTIDGAMDEFRGNIEQVPSAVSAIKVDGKRAYARVRAGEEVTLEPRSVTVSCFEIWGAEGTGDEPPITVGRIDAGDGSVSVVDVQVRVECSSGTYIRALARDLGKAIGSAGHLVALRRTRVGPWTLADAVTLENLADAAEAGESLPLISLDKAAARVFPRVLINQPAASRFAHGVAPEISDVEDLPSAILNADGTVVAVSAKSDPERVLGLVRTEGGRFKTQNVMVTSSVTGE